MQKNKYSIKRRLQLLSVGSLFAGLNTITIFLLHIPIGSTGGYFHIADAWIYIAASLLPTPYAVCSAAIGGALGDIISVFPVWAPFTFVIKSLIALLFTSKQDFLCKRNILALLLAWIISGIGYYVSEALIYGNWIAPAASILGNFLQSAGSAALFIVLAFPMDRMNLKLKLYR